MPYCLPIVTVTNDFSLAFWKVFWSPSIYATHKNIQRYFVLFFLSWPFFSGATLDASYELSSSLSYCEILVKQLLSFTGTAVLVKIQSPAVSNTGTAGEWGMPQQPLPCYTFPSYCTSRIFPVNVRWLTDLLQTFSFFFHLVGSQSASNHTAFYSFAVL